MDFLEAAYNGASKVVGTAIKAYSRYDAFDRKAGRYTHEALPDATCIRLLKVNGVGEHDCLECSLETFRLDEAPPYHALSYTWGNPFSWPPWETSSVWAAVPGKAREQLYQGFCHKVIRINGEKRIYIGLNLWEALRTLLKPEMKSHVPHKYIWADAICIMQDPKCAEKQQQILLMGKIYMGAASVIVWLGSALEHTGDAVSAINKLADLKISDVDRMKRMSIFEDSTYDSLNIPLISNPERLALFGFLRRQWFSRVWVVQELFFANNHQYIVGNFSISSHAMNQASQILVLSGWTVQLETALGGNIGKHDPRPGAVASLYQMRIEGRTLGLLKPTNILQSTRGRHSSEPLDHVYALLNVIAEGQGIAPAALSIQPEYSAKLDDVLEAATLLCLETDRSLHVLSAVQSQPSPRNRPSWVVDWTTKQNIQPLTIYDVWNPSKTSATECPSFDVKHVLKFRACQVCKISIMSEIGDSIIENHDFAALFSPFLEDQYPGHSQKDILEPIWRTTITDIIHGETPAPQSFAITWLLLCIRSAAMQAKGKEDTFRRKLDELQECFKRLRAKFPSLQTMSEDEIESVAIAFASEGSDELLSAYAMPLKDMDVCWQNFTERMTGRCIAIMDDNNIGLVPKWAQSGDSIWIVPGMNVMYTLHAKQESYEFLGEAYVHGYMNGAAKVGAWQTINLT